jgi:hypothetical protein
LGKQRGVHKPAGGADALILFKQIDGIADLL